MYSTCCAKADTGLVQPADFPEPAMALNAGGSVAALRQAESDSWPKLLLQGMCFQLRGHQIALCN
jgi:hypothetical protein